MSGANSERRLTELGTGNWNNRGIDNHVKRPAGVSSAGLKRMGMKRIEGIESKVRESTVESSLKWPKQCLVDNEFVYDGLAVDHLPRSRSADPAFNAPAGIEASKTVHMHNHGALSEKERDGPEGGRSPAWLIGAQTKRRVPAPFQIHNPEPVKHEYLKPHNVKSRSMRRMGYENAASRQNWNMQKQQLNTGPLSHEGMSLDDWKQVSKKVHVNECGEIIFMAGGMEDLRPACTQALTKADKGASMVTNYLNDSRDLARFERRKTWAYTDEQWGRGNPQLAESPDMEHCMTGGPRTPSASAYDESCAPSSRALSCSSARRVVHVLATSLPASGRMIKAAPTVAGVAEVLAAPVRLKALGPLTGTSEAACVATGLLSHRAVIRSRTLDADRSRKTACLAPRADLAMAATRSREADAGQSHRTVSLALKADIAIVPADTATVRADTAMAARL